MQPENNSRKGAPPNLRKQFLKLPCHQSLYESYLETHDSVLLEKLNQAYSDFVNYTVLLSLIHTNVKYRSLHMREHLSQIRQELVSEEKLEYILNQQSSGMPPSVLDQWETILGNDQLLDAVTTLTERQQQVLWLLFVEGLPATEAREYLKVSPQAISRAKQRALTKIKQRMEEEKE